MPLITYIYNPCSTSASEVCKHSSQQCGKCILNLYKRNFDL